MKDIVFDICERMLRNSPERSYKRLNPALRATLANCIAADLPFRRDTFKKIYNELRGGWWFGDGAGSSMGEHYYTEACECNHASAQQSFEHFAERPAVLWEENAGTPERLHVGSLFTWRGYYVTVTSMRKDSLVACTYNRGSEPIGIRVGATVGYNPSWIILSSKRKGKVALVKLQRLKDNNPYTAKVNRRFTILYSEIVQFRRTEKARVKAMLEKIANCNPEADRETLTREINSSHFRHFELENIQKAFRARIKEILDKETAEQTRIRIQARVKEWLDGKGGPWLDIDDVILRVVEDRVECSNGNSVTVAAARRVLPVVMANRKKHAQIGMPIDNYTVRSVDHQGVIVGCTMIPWPEIERIAPQLKAA